MKYSEITPEERNRKTLLSQTEIPIVKLIPCPKCGYRTVESHRGIICVGCGNRIQNCVCYYKV